MLVSKPGGETGRTMGRRRHSDEEKTTTVGDVEEATRSQEAGEEKEWCSGRFDAVDQMIKKLEGKFGERDFTASIADYIRLIQIRKELGEERPREIKISWEG